MNFFQDLLRGLSEKLGVVLKEDALGGCALLVSESLMVQLELDKEEKHLIFGAHLGELVPGKYREELLQLALKENGRSYPHIGILGYQKRAGQLAIFDVLRISMATSDVVFEVLQIFAEKALAWQKALQEGVYPREISLPEQESSPVLR